MFPLSSCRAKKPRISSGMTRKSILTHMLASPFTVSDLNVARWAEHHYLRTNAFSSASVHVISWPSSSLRLSWLSENSETFFSSAISVGLLVSGGARCSAIPHEAY